jgi:hypothetical protein
MKLPALFLVTALALPAQTQSFGGFADAHVRVLRSDELTSPVSVKGRLPLTVVLLRGSSWSEGRVLRDLRRTAETFAACGVALGPVALVEAKAPDKRSDLDMRALDPVAGVPLAVSRIAALLPPDAHWPVAFFAGRLLGDTAIARSYGRGDVAPERHKDFPYMDTAWFAYKAHWIERRDKQYSSLAHELVHLLCECEHVPDSEPHLMNTYRNLLSSRILPKQCKAIWASPLLTSPAPPISDTNP